MITRTNTKLQDALNACKTVFIIAFGFSFFLNILALITPMYSLQILDRVLTSGSLETLIMLTVAMIATYAIIGTLTIIRSAIFIQVGKWLDTKLSETLVDKSIFYSIQNKTLSGAQPLRDLTTLKTFLTGPGLGAIFDVPWTPIYVIVIFLIHPYLSIITLVGIIISVALTYLNETKTKKILDKANEDNLASMEEIESATRNAEAIEAMGMRKHIVSRWWSHHKTGIEGQLLASKTNNIISSLTKVFRMLLQMSVYAFGGYFTLLQQMTAGGMIAGSILTGRAMAPFDALIGSWKSMIAARKSYTRLQKLLTSPERHSGIELPEPQGAINIGAVNFIIPQTRQQIIKNASLEIPKGASVGLIGPSGAGKTTLAKLIIGILPASSGAVRLDGADVYNWNRDQFGDHVGYLPQEVSLFRGSIKDNIARFKEEVSDEEIITAAKDAHVHDFILSLPKGYETEIGISGTHLSAGQRQRIALARAMFGTPKLIVLDEPNSNLDFEGEQALGKALMVAKQKGSTTIIISHRPTILGSVDLLVAMKDGSIALSGPPQEVMAKLSGTTNGQEVA